MPTRLVPASMPAPTVLTFRHAKAVSRHPVAGLRGRFAGSREPRNLLHRRSKADKPRCLFSPSGESMLVDGGMGRVQPARCRRIIAAAKTAGVKEDRLPGDHSLPCRPRRRRAAACRKDAHSQFVDHGPQTETTRDAQVLYNAYIAFRDKGNHIQVKPGDVIPIKGIEGGAFPGRRPARGLRFPGAGQPDAEWRRLPTA